MSFWVDMPHAHTQCITKCDYVITILTSRKPIRRIGLASECSLVEPLPSMLKAGASPISHGIIGNFVQFLANS